jgi:hypothetical protein
MQEVKDLLQSLWEMTNLGKHMKIVRIKITLSDRTITILQTKYIKNILIKEGFKKANPVCMPLDLNLTLVPNPDGNVRNKSNLYIRLLGELQFLTNAMRPDIAYAINRLASYTANPSIQHITALKRVLRYLAGTKDHSITYKDLQEHPNHFYRMADMAYTNANDRKSTSGHVFIASGGAITWRSKKQTLIALSSTEAEYVTLSEAACEACWLRSLYHELGLQQKYPTQIWGDNKGTLAMAKDAKFHQ